MLCIEVNRQEVISFSSMVCLIPLNLLSYSSSENSLGALDPFSNFMVCVSMKDEDVDEASPLRTKRLDMDKERDNIGTVV